MTDIPHDPDTTAILLDLLKRAAAAHGIHEKTDLGGVYDNDWPQWYAAHMTKALADAGYRIVKADKG
jgi:hypothetical protein